MPDEGSVIRGGLKRRSTQFSVVAEENLKISFLSDDVQKPLPSFAQKFVPALLSVLTSLCSPALNPTLNMQPPEYVFRLVDEKKMSTLSLSEQGSFSNSFTRIWIMEGS